MVSECMLLVDLQERLGSMKQGKIQVMEELMGGGMEDDGMSTANCR